MVSVETKNNTINNTSTSKSILTERELEYLVLVAIGCHNSQIAKEIGVSYYTVKKTLELIFSKLHAKDRANAVALAFIHGILNSNVLVSVTH